METDHLKEAHEGLANLSANLPKEIDLIGLSRRYKTAGKVHMLREALIWRQEELARSALAAIERNDGVTSALITRATMETAAAIVYLYGLVERAIDKGITDELDEKLTGFLTGSKVWEDVPGAIQVLNMIDAADKLLPGYRYHYEVLCEFAHPNWSGTLGAYGIIDKENLTATFVKNGRSPDTCMRNAVPMLAASIELFIGYYNALADKLIPFATACEAYYEGGDIPPEQSSGGVSG